MPSINWKVTDRTPPVSHSLATFHPKQQHWELVYLDVLSRWLYHPLIKKREEEGCSGSCCWFRFLCYCFKTLLFSSHSLKRLSEGEDSLSERYIRKERSKKVSESRVQEAKIKVEEKREREFVFVWKVNGRPTDGPPNGKGMVNERERETWETANRRIEWMEERLFCSTFCLLLSSSFLLFSLFCLHEDVNFQEGVDISLTGRLLRTTTAAPGVGFPTLVREEGGIDDDETEEKKKKRRRLSNDETEKSLWFASPASPPLRQTQQQQQ